MTKTTKNETICHLDRKCAETVKYVYIKFKCMIKVSHHQLPQRVYYLIRILMGKGENILLYYVSGHDQTIQDWCKNFYQTLKAWKGLNTLSNTARFERDRLSLPVQKYSHCIFKECKNKNNGNNMYSITVFVSVTWQKVNLIFFQINCFIKNRRASFII